MISNPDKFFAGERQKKKKKKPNRRSWKYFLWSVDFCLKSPEFLLRYIICLICLSVSTHTSIFLAIYHLSNASKFILYMEQVERADRSWVVPIVSIYAETKLIQNYYYSHCVIKLITVNDLLENQVTGSGFQQWLL